MQRWTHTVVALAMLAVSGCGAPGALSTGVDTQSQAESLSQADLVRLKPLVERLFARYAAGEPLTADDIAQVQPYAQEVYADLSRDAKFRTQAYKVSDPAVAKQFSKADKPDQVPPVRGAALDKLMATLQPGDVVQCGNDGSFIHSLFYVGDGVIVHALAQPMAGKPRAGVIQETLAGYFQRVERDTVVVLRPKWTDSQLKKATTYIKAQVGKDYDTLFLSDSEDRFYCTELVYRTLKAGGVSKVAPHLAQGLWPMVMNEDFRAAGDLSVIYRVNHD